jgi:hypothetical protein
MDPQKQTTFWNCVLYLASEVMGDIVRRDCRLVTITEGVKYAQYNNAIKIEYTPKNARKRRSFYQTYNPFLVVLRAEDAVEPDSMLGPDTPGSNPGVTVSKSRYSCFDRRWRSNFVAGLAVKNIQPLFQVGKEYNTIEASKTVA